MKKPKGIQEILHKYQIKQGKEAQKVTSFSCAINGISSKET